MTSHEVKYIFKMNVSYLDNTQFIHSLRAFSHKWLKMKKVFTLCLHVICNLTHSMVVSSMPVPFAGNPNFVNTFPLLHIQHSIYVRQVEFFVFTMKQIASIFCNVSFAVRIFLNPPKLMSGEMLSHLGGRDKPFRKKITYKHNVNAKQPKKRFALYSFVYWKPSLNLFAGVLFWHY